MSGGPLRVVHVLGTLDVGGAERCALDLCRTIPTDRVEQAFVCLAGRPGVLAGQFADAGAEVIALRPRWRALFFLDLYRLLRRRRPDVVVSHVSLASGPILLIAALAGVRRRLARMHSSGDGRGAGPLRSGYRWLAGSLLALTAQRIDAVSDSAAAFACGHGMLRGRLAARTRVVPNGVDLSRFQVVGSRRATAPRTAVHVGRAAPEKNRALLAPILAELRRHGDWRLLALGPGDPGDLGPDLPPQLEVLGARDDVPAVLAGCDVLVLPSLREGMPGVVLEALGCGVPVVASDLPETRELAAVLAGITLVPLSAPLDRWAGAIEDAADLAGEARRELSGQLAGSRFDLLLAAREWPQRWAG